MPINVPFVNLTKARGTGIPFVDFDSNNGPKGVLGVNTGAGSTTRTNYGPTQLAPNTTDPASWNRTGTLAGGAAAQASDPNLAAQYQDVINQYQGQLGGLGEQEQNGLNTVGNSYNEATGQLEQQLGLGKRQYEQQLQQNTQNYATTRNNAVTQTRSQANALQRLLGMNGAGNSSAATEQAPYAAALQGSQLINGAQRTYAENAANADNNWAQTSLSASQQRKKLDADKADKENQVRSKVLETRTSLLDQIRQNSINRDMANGRDYKTAAAGQAGLQQQQQQLLGQISQLGKVNPVAFDNSTIQYKTPDMAQYSLDGQQAPQMASQAGPEGNVDPTFLSMLGSQKKKNQYGQLAY